MRKQFAQISLQDRASFGAANCPSFQFIIVRGGHTLHAHQVLVLAGALFQSLTRNPLASPDMLGVTGGAQLAAILVPALAGVATVPLLFVCGLAAADGWRATPLRLVLAGGVRMLLFAALSTLVLAFFEQNIAGAALWTNGSLYQPGATGLALVARCLVVPLVALPFVIRLLNPLTLSYVGLVAPNLLRQVRGARALVGTPLILGCAGLTTAACRAVCWISIG